MILLLLFLNKPTRAVTVSIHWWLKIWFPKLLLKCQNKIKTSITSTSLFQVNAKYSEELAQEVLEWIGRITNEDFNRAGDMDNFYEVLKDGTLLCRLVNNIKPGSVKKINESKMAFKCMENISAFLAAARDLGVPAQETFQTVDLWERQNLNSVVICLQSLGRKVFVWK